MNQSSFNISLPVGNALDTLFSCAPFLIELNNPPLPPTVADVVVAEVADAFIKFPIDYKSTMSLQ